MDSGYSFGAWETIFASGLITYLEKQPADGLENVAQLLIPYFNLRPILEVELV